MNTEEITFRHTTTAHGNIYKTHFAGSTIELADDRQSLQIIDGSGEHETWTFEDNIWIFIDGSNGQAPTAGWPESYFRFLENAIAAIA